MVVFLRNWFVFIVNRKAVRWKLFTLNGTCFKFFLCFFWEKLSYVCEKSYLHTFLLWQIICSFRSDKVTDTHFQKLFIEMNGYFDNSPLNRFKYLWEKGVEEKKYDYPFISYELVKWPFKTSTEFPFRIFPRYADIAVLSTADHWLVIKPKSSGCSAPHTQVI